MAAHRRDEANGKKFGVDAKTFSSPAIGNGIRLRPEPGEGRRLKLRGLLSITKNESAEEALCTDEY
jgi:hypothetical protein